ncbi:hypothetical protein AAFF_G00232370 [Aldrovandia affinis]|uniref:Laminin G domain-containing protein n=1 Tax=Aldrovandia affinis TaxID=143900 RepID=A0AAD7RFC8_9TELE|nr:hypothetical protein AAFF_G00232370 [Aldrovandia affinis]
MPIRRQVVTRSYVGCMKNVEIARTNLDLLRDAFGVRKGCVLRPIRAVTVLKEGFLELPPLILAPPLDMMTTFSTRTDTGLILAGFGKAGSQQSLQPFLAVMLVSGQLEAHLRMEEGRIVHKAVLKSSTGSLSDGQEHSVILQYRGRTVTVLVDEDREGMMRLSSSETVILTLDRLYIGGVPPAEGAGMLRTPSSFCGCIKNLALNMELLDLSSALRYRNVDMDSCLLEEKPKSPVLLDDNGTTAGPAHSPAMPLEKCAPDDQTGRVPGAHQFGLSRNSHMIYTISHQVIRASFSLQLSVQTFASSGLLFYMAHPKQADYATLQLQGGRPSFTCNLGESPSTASHPEAINDGHWHTVRVDFGGKGVAVSVDGRESEPAEVKGNTLYLYHLDKLYLGGVPPGYSGGNISTGTHSVAGCVRDVALNDRPLDTRSLVSSSGTAGCFSTAQRGSFFNGTGFAAFVEEGYKVGQDVTVALEFRTTSPDGVLLGISSARADAIGLELDSGRVHFHVNNGAGRISVTYGAQGSFGLCDGRWHILLATKSNYGLSLTVDGVTVHGENPHPQSTSADTNDPIYVGGYPGHVTQNCLTISAPFRGCMRDLRLIRGHMTSALNFTTAFDLRESSHTPAPG